MTDTPYRDLTPITNVVRGVLIALSIVEAVNVIALLMQNDLLVSFGNHSFSGDFMQAARANDLRIRIISVLQGITVLAMFVLFLRWVYRAMSNVHALGAREVEGPGWSVGSFFVPFANLVIPYNAMSQIWRASLSVERWKEESAPIIGIWWALWLLLGITGWLFFWFGTDHHIDAAIARTRYHIAYSVLEIARNFLMIAIVAGVLSRQKTQWDLINSSKAASVTPS